MDFIVDNYVWFIVVGIIILMAVVGYIADKTDFGRKGKDEDTKEKKVEKPKKEKKIKEKKEKIKVEAKGINELTQEVAENNKVDVQESNDLNVVEPVQNVQVNNENIDQSLFAPLTDNVNEVIPQNNEAVENTELKNVEPAKLENPIQENNNQTVAEDEDIWKF